MASLSFCWQYNLGCNTYLYSCCLPSWNIYREQSYPFLAFPLVCKTCQLIIYSLVKQALLFLDHHGSPIISIAHFYSSPNFCSMKWSLCLQKSLPTSISMLASNEPKRREVLSSQRNQQQVGPSHYWEQIQKVGEIHQLRPIHVNQSTWTWLRK